MHEMGLQLLAAVRIRIAAAAAKHGCQWWGGALPLCLAACTAMPASFAELPWSDHWGDRGRGVLERDFGMCGELVESHRSQFATCMASRGWSLDR